ncbi:MAG TPA: alpha/beta hydrolase [Dongiaceae bacterium]|nr:alpha/beta hydrolase [Dongiaceae bacterium]
MNAVLKSREMLKEVQIVHGREYCCYIKGNCGSDRIADLVFFNGLFSGASSWAYQTRLPALLKNFRLVMFDYPSQGGSSPVTEGMTAFHLLQDISQLFVQLEVRNPLLIGHSVGGMLAGVMSGLHPTDQYLKTQIQGMFATNCGNTVPGHTKNLFDDIETKMLDIHRAELTTDGVRSAIKDVFRVFVPQSLDAGYQEMMLPFMEDLLEGYADYNHDPQAVAHLLRLLSEWDMPNKGMLPFLGQVVCPVQLVAGANDKLFPPLQVKEMAESFPNAECFTVANAGHSVMLEQSREFNELLLAFVGQTYGSASIEAKTVRRQA